MGLPWSPLDALCKTPARIFKSLADGFDTKSRSQRMHAPLAAITTLERPQAVHSPVTI